MKSHPASTSSRNLIEGALSLEAAKNPFDRATEPVEGLPAGGPFKPFLEGHPCFVARFTCKALSAKAFLQVVQCQRDRRLLGPCYGNGMGSPHAPKWP